ncbi:MAG: hypothetical protein KBD63_08295 [Bacteriovoracaceae bacterium]|nr:hypothetical protein [Bacteriovoracaceae bacterium]
MKKTILLFLIFFASVNVWSNVDPDYLKLKIYKFAVSASPLCTNPITIFENASPDYIDFLGNPVLGSGSIANNTYPCVIIEFSDVIKFRPATNESPYCDNGTEYSLEVCRDDNGITPFKLVDGTTGNCVMGEERIAMYITTGASSNSNSNAFEPPTFIGDTDHAFNLGAPLIVSSDTIGKFIVNGTGQVDGTGTFTNSCEMNPPVFSFSKE